MKLCENCNSLPPGNFGSKRFCSKSCSRSFSTRNKRLEINTKVKDKLTKPLIELKCIECDSIFLKHIKYKKQECCSKKCSALHRNKNPNYREKISQSMIKAHVDGIMSGVPKNIRCFYEINGEKIRCDSKVEYACLNYFENNFKIISIERSRLVLKYEYNGKNKNYLPDFIIKTTIGDFIVECKCFFKITEAVKLNKSWTIYYETIELKRAALKKYCKENGLKEFFFIKDLHRKFYNTCKPSKINI